MAGKTDKGSAEGASAAAGNAATGQGATGDDARAQTLAADKLLEDQAKRIEELERELGGAKGEAERLRDELATIERRHREAVEDLEKERVALLRENGELRGALRKATKDMVPDLEGRACVLKESVTLETTTKQRVQAQPGDICVAAPDEKLTRARQELGKSKRLLSVTAEQLQEFISRGLAQPA